MRSSFSGKADRFSVGMPKLLSKLTRLDFVLLFGLILVYSLFAFIQLGGTKFPQTSWTPEFDAEVDVDFGSIQRITSYKWLVGHTGEQSFEIGASNDGVNWRFMSGIDQENDNENIFKWSQMYGELAIARYVKVVAVSESVDLLELAFFNESNIIPIQSVSRGGEALFDEQEMVPKKHNGSDGFYFDEILFARTAYDYLQGLPPHEIEHPPLGKLIISVGIKIFGMSPFGWRFMGAIFGILMIPLIYIFAKKMFGETFWAFFAAMLFGFDFMRFTLTRVATVDVFVTFFVMGMFLFMYIYSKKSFYFQELKSTLAPLMLSGIFMGLAVATKWNGGFAALGLAALFSLTIYKRYREYIFVEKGMCNDSETLKLVTKTAFIKKTCQTVLWCVLFFIVVPGAIYYMSYIPYLNQLNIRPYQLIEGITAIINQILYIFGFHAGFSHEFDIIKESAWWTWPLNLHPLLISCNASAIGERVAINSFGNPAVWWMGLISFFLCVSTIVRRFKKGKHDGERKVETPIFLVIAYLSPLLPWILVPRSMFIYHYFPCVPFLVLMTTFVFKEYIHRISKRLTYAFMFISVALFIAFYPILSGTLANNDYVSTFLEWLPTWEFLYYD